MSALSVLIEPFAMIARHDDQGLLAQTLRVKPGYETANL
jgi:hypothetical protein